MINEAKGGLDPEDWEAFRAEAHTMLEAALDRMQGAAEGRVWTMLPEDQKTGLQAPLPHRGQGIGAVREGCEALLPYGVGNTHPRFFRLGSWKRHTGQYDCRDHGGGDEREPWWA